MDSKRELGSGKNYYFVEEGTEENNWLEGKEGDVVIAYTETVPTYIHTYMHADIHTYILQNRQCIATFSVSEMS